MTEKKNGVTPLQAEVPREGHDGDEPLVKIVTMNQLVAFNVAYWRKYLGGTQEELGKRIAEFNRGEPWSKANVSAAERTWEGSRVRRFDADDLLMLARVLEVPIAGLFLPPEDAGPKVRYVIGDSALPPDDESHLEMGDFLSYLITLDEEDDCGCGALGRYGRRFEALVDYYIGHGTYRRWVKESEQEDRQSNIAQLSRVRTQVKELRGLLGDLERVQEDLSRRESEQVNDRINGVQEHGSVDPVQGVPEHVKEQILDLYRSGESIRTIALEVKQQKSQVFAVLHRAGAYVKGKAHADHMRALAVKAADRYKNGESLESIGRDLSHSLPHLYRVLLFAGVSMRSEDTSAFLLEEWEEFDRTDAWDRLQ